MRFQTDYVCKLLVDLIFSDGFSMRKRGRTEHVKVSLVGEEMGG